MRLGKADPDQAYRQKAQSRFARLSGGEIVDWMDVAGSGLARALNDYRRLSSPESLVEGREAILALLAGVDELQRRG